MDAIIKRESYLNQIIQRKHNGLIKIITGIRRCGKSYLLRTLYKAYLLESGVKGDHIIEMAFDLYDNIEYRDPKIFYPWITEQLKDDDKYYILLDEVQPFYNEDGILIMSVYDFLLDSESLEF